jgi:hypothetical protein
VKLVNIEYICVFLELESKTFLYFVKLVLSEHALDII